MISVQDAEARILAAAGPLGPEARPLAEALGAVLAEPLVSSTWLPPFDNSAMDGYAVRAADLAGASPAAPARLALLGAVAAGQVWDRPLKRQAAVQIMTGAPVPTGADTIVILEEARRRDGALLVDHPVPAGRHIRRRGEDVEPGRPVLPAGRRIRPAELALLAGLGCRQVTVFRAPRVAVVATGSELVAADRPLTPGAIRDSNTWALAGWLKTLGVPVVNLGVVPDEERAIVRAFREASACDVILCSGGVSVGEYDLVKRLLAQQFAFETLFWRVRMKPGKPLLVGLLDGKLFFGLPGNPISCAVCFVRFIAPALRRMMGDPAPGPVSRRAVLASPLAFRETDRAYFVTAQVAWGAEPPRATPTSRQGSGMLTSMTDGNALIVVPEGVATLPAGAEVEVLPDD